MESIRYHPLVDMTTDGSVKTAMFFSDNEASVKGKHKLYLTEIVPHSFRLCSSTEMTAEETSGFELHCPYCGNKLKEISRPTSGLRHGLYRCERCE